MDAFRMPTLGAGMDHGRVVEWLVAPGDAVRRGDLVAVIETDKAAIEVEIWQDGVIGELLVPEGTRVPVGTPLATLGPVSAAAAAPAAPLPVEAGAPAVMPPPAPAVVTEPAVVGPLARRRASELGVDLRTVQGTGAGGAITRHDVEVAGMAARAHPEPTRVTPAPRAGAASPYARRLAADRGTELGTLTGSGPGGAIVARDVVAPASRGPVTPPAVPEAEGAPPATAPREPREAAMRRAIAKAMERANREIPHYHLGLHVDVSPSLSWLEERNADRPPDARVLPAALFLTAVVRTLVEVPELNGHWIDGAFRPGAHVDLGVVTSLRGGGLMVPVIAAAEDLDLDGLMQRLREVVRRTRSGRLRASDLAEGTISVTNLGDLGVETVHGVIYPPQVALVGFGRPTERPWAEAGLLGVRTVVHVTLAADHRQTDGQLGSRFLTLLAQRLSRPEEW